MASEKLFTQEGPRSLDDPEGSSFLCVSDPHGLGVDSLREAKDNHSTLTQGTHLADSWLGVDAASVDPAPSSSFFKCAAYPSPLTRSQY